MDTLMGSEDRDRKFEKALAKQLRSSAAEDSFARNAACPDAEILAAYHERSLSLEELNSWKSHIAGCARCQEILSQLELTDAIPVDAETAELEKQSLVSAGRLDAYAANQELFMSSAAPAKVRATARVAESKRAQVTTLQPRRTPWRWIAPAGAIAAGLLVWVTLHEKSKLTPTQPREVQVARNREPAAPPATAPVSQAEPAGKPGPVEEKKKASSQRLPVSPPAGLTARTFSAGQPNLPAKNAIAPPPPGPPMLTADAMSTDRLADKGAVAGVGGMLKQSGAPKPPAPTGARRANGAFAGASVSRAKQVPPARVADAPVPSATDSEQAGNRGIPAASESVEVTAAAPQAEMRKVQSKSMLQELPNIVASNGHTTWIVGPSGFIERSDDAGKTWKLQNSGVKNDLRAGAAPSESICWVVGNAGVILRTTDGGENWTKIASPVAGDISAVDASSEFRAVVTDAATNKRYATADGGLSWTLLSAE
jgi:Photosynthesis system II assembly factor YCF48